MASFVDGLIDVGDDVKRVEDDHRLVAEVLFRPGDIRRAQVEGNFRDRPGVPVVPVHLGDEGLPHRLVLAPVREQDAFADQIAKHAHILMALAHVQFVAADADHPASICLGVGRGDLCLEHPPQPRIDFFDMPGHRRHWHLPHQ